MDLDKKELEATRKMGKTADEMFEELGYMISEEIDKRKDKYSCGIQFKKENNITVKYIEFYYYHKQICIFEEQYIRDEIVRHKCNILDMQELQAINKKCEELNWLDG